jgi:hypothetical protein
MWCLICDMDGGLQPHVPQQFQPLPTGTAFLIVCGEYLLRRRHRARHQETKGQIFYRLTALGDGDSHLHQSNQVNQLGGQHMDSMREEVVEDGTSKRLI